MTEPLTKSPIPGEPVSHFATGEQFEKGGKRYMVLANAGDRVFAIEFTSEGPFGQERVFDKNDTVTRVLAREFPRSAGLMSVAEPKQIATRYRVDALGLRTWHEVASFRTLEEAQLALADAGRFPMDKTYRIVKVTEEWMT